MKNVMITAHSGCEGTPDNSMESILTGIALGADCVEIDVRTDGAGGLWLTHDRPEDFRGTVSLEEAFRAIVQGNIAVNCDLKEYEALYPVLELAEKCGLAREKLIFSGSVDPALLAKDETIARRARIFLNSEEICRYLAPELPDDRTAHVQFFAGNVKKIAEMLHGLGVEALNAPYRYTTGELAAALRAEGAALSLWTVNDEENLRRLLNEDVLNITTRTVRSALRLREEIRGMRYEQV